MAQFIAQVTGSRYGHGKAAVGKYIADGLIVTVADVIPTKASGVIWEMKKDLSPVIGCCVIFIVFVVVFVSLLLLLFLLEYVATVLEERK